MRLLPPLPGKGLWYSVCNFSNKKVETMNKIILQSGLLIFFFSVIYFTQRGMSMEKILLNSFVIFIIVTSMLSIIVIGIIKAINRNSLNKLGDYSENLAGKSKHE